MYPHYYYYYPAQIVSAVAIVVSLAMLTTTALPAKHRNLSLKDKLALELPLKHLVDEKSGLTHSKVAFPFAPPTTNHIFTTDADEDGDAPTTVIITNAVTTPEGTTPEMIVVTKTTATKIPGALIPTLPEADDDVPSVSTTVTTSANTRTPGRPVYVDAALFRATGTATTRTNTPTTTTTTTPTTTPTTTTTTTTTSAPAVPEHAALIRQSSADSYDYEGYFRVWDDLSPFGGEVSDALKGYPGGGFRPFGF